MIKKIFARIQSISCHQASVLMSKQLDRRLSLREGFQLMSHLVVCDGCKIIRRQLEEIHRFLRLAFKRQAAASIPSRSLSPEAKERIKQRLTLE